MPRLVDVVSPTTREIADIITRANSGDPEADPAAFDRLLDDEVTWEVLGRGVSWARTYRGKAELYSEYMGKLQGRFDPAATTITNVDTFVDDEQGAIVFHNHDEIVLRSGERVDVDVMLVMRVVDGKITSVRELMDLREVSAVLGDTLD